MVRRKDEQALGEGVARAVEVTCAVEVARMEAMRVLVAVVFVTTREVSVDVVIVVDVVVSVCVVVRLVMEVWSCVIGSVRMLVVVAWNVLVMLTNSVGVVVVVLVRVTKSVEGWSVDVFPNTPSCWQAVEYALRSRQGEA
jgi:hypothetical protein